MKTVELPSNLPFLRRLPERTIVVSFISKETCLKGAAERRQSLLEYPIENIPCLELDESRVLENPVETEYGFKIVQEYIPCQRIEEYKNNNYEELSGCLLLRRPITETSFTTEKDVIIKKSHRLIEFNMAIEHADYAVTHA